ncbi:MAG: nicotinate phosphoribosyltransferase, nicotinate phosphoribosyltransferase [Candidatus Saccharibacteria bacterium]|nr:nicotinate phosphoribosyltransferase, nicotinate phosphoribosyltransferase [Candidatus Saccharibacteria bacterium]
MNEQQPNLSRGLDFYKLTMGDMAYEKHPDAEVTFTLKNRRGEQPLSEFVTKAALQERLDAIRERGFSPEEIAYYAGLQAQDGGGRFTPAYLNHLADLQLPDVEIDTHAATGELTVQTTGPWADVSLWETVVMSEINEEYYARLMEVNDLSIDDLYTEGDRRLDEKIARLQARPDIKFSDFGTRRRFSAAWHEHVISRLAQECPGNFVGTSNPWFAYKYDLTPIGTFAHEMPMVYAGLEDAAGNNPLNGHAKMLKDWQEHYGGDLSIALTDTFGSEFFFTDFTPEQAHAWRGLRHDSGDPIAFGEHVIDFYARYEIDPTTKTIVFSDGLDIDMIEKLADHFSGKTNLMFGWGTSLTNDLGLPSNNIVMKATHVNGNETVKLSDDKGKHTGPEHKVARYQSAVAEKIAKSALKEVILA